MSPTRILHDERFAKEYVRYRQQTSPEAYLYYNENSQKGNIA